MKIKSSMKSIRLNFSLESDLKVQVEVQGNTIYMRGKAPTHMINMDRRTPYMFYEEGEKSIAFEMAVRILSREGDLGVVNNTLMLEDSDEVVILATADPSFVDFQSEPDKVLDCTSILDRAEQAGFEQLYQEHVKDYQSLFNRVTLELHGENQLQAEALPPEKQTKSEALPPEKQTKNEALPIDKRLVNIRNGTKDIDMTELLFHYGTACRKSLEKRLSYGGGITGWSSSWLICLYARLGDGNMCGKMLEKMKHQLIYDNLMDCHPPFQIDGNFGLVAGVAEMLLQSHQDKLVILPAVCEKWRKGSFTGLRARGGYEVSATWEDGQITWLQIAKGDKTVLERRDKLPFGYAIVLRDL